jgi:hypothetical protein
MKPIRPSLFGTSPASYSPLPMGFNKPFTSPKPPPFYAEGGIVEEQEKLDKEMDKEMRKGNFYQRK